MNSYFSYSLLGGPQVKPSLDSINTLPTFISNVEQSAVYTKSYSDGKSFRISLLIELPGLSQEEVNNSAVFMLSEHIKQQFDNIRRSLRHEARNCIKFSQKKAIECIKYRMLEGYYCWVEKQGVEPISTGNPFAELLLYRVMLSLAEHILHCPERVIQIFHTVLMEKVENMKAPYVIDVMELQRGLSQIHSCNKFPLINFDDINQCASGNTRRLRKSWHESQGAFVLIDIIRNYYPVVFFKAWVFAFVLWLRHESDQENQNSLFFWQEVAYVDGTLYVIIELILFFYTYFVQERGQSWSRRSLYRVVGCFFGLVCFLWVWVHRPNTLQLISYFFVGRLLLCTIYLPIIESWLGRDKNFVKHGRPRAARREQNVEKFTIEEEEERLLNDQNICNVLKKIIWEPFSKIHKTNCQTFLFWILMLATTCLFEYFLVAPISGNINFESLCFMRRREPSGRYSQLCPDYIKLSSHKCTACFFSVLCVYILVVLSVFIDLYLVFNSILAIVGYFKGRARGVHDIFNPSRKLNLEKTGNFRESFENLFGPWSRSKQVWSALTNSLYNRDLISNAQCEELNTYFDSDSIEDHKKFQDVLEKLTDESQDRITYFLKTVESIGKKEEKRVVQDVHHPDFEETEMEFLESVPSLSQVITTYTEHILLSTAFLKKKTGSKSNFQYLIEKYPDEWEFFEERMKKKKIYSAISSAPQLLKDFLQKESLSKELVNEIRLWASHRSQTVARTIRGALEYHNALRVRLSWVAQENSRRATSSKSKFGVSDMVELLIAAQTYGKCYNTVREQQQEKERRDDLNFLLHRYKEYPISIIIDYEKQMSDSKDKQEILQYWNHANKERRRKTACYNAASDISATLRISMNQMPQKVLHIIEEYIGEIKSISRSYMARDSNQYFSEASFPFKYATLIKSINPKTNALELTSIIPRLYPLRLGKGKYRTQGKAGNQLNVTRKIWGHVTQVMDANMDGFIADGFKFPFITHKFLSRNNSGRKRKSHTHRKYVNHRIIGFREYIFTGRLSWAAASMASSEATFGSIFQRVLDDPLDVRMHYGHPDFFDSFWVLNRGGLSKASPRINLSEDIFAGYNVWLRGEDTVHVDSIEWQKGRETVFTTASMFLSKISYGAVGILRSRDSMDMNAGLNLLRRVSLFSGVVSYFITSIMLSFTFYLYAAIFFLFAIADLSQYDLEGLNSSLSFEWVLGVGFVSMFPFLSEQLLERGCIRGSWVWLCQVIPSTLFYIFQNQTVAHAFGRGIITGEASYINTGRPLFFVSYSKKFSYELYCRSHYYPALFIGSLYSYRAFVSPSSVVSFPLFMLLSVVFIWITGPVWFCPKKLELEAFWFDWKETARFLSSVDDRKQSSSLLNFWKIEHEKDYQVGKTLPTITNGLIFLMMYLCLNSLASHDSSTYTPFVLIFLIHILFTFFWQLSHRFPVLTFLWVLSPMVSFIFIWAISDPNVTYGVLSMQLPIFFDNECFIMLALFIILIRMFTILILLLASLLIRVLCGSSTKFKNNYQWLMTGTYYYCLHYHMHLYFAFLIFSLQWVIQAILLPIGFLYRLVFHKEVIEEKSESFSISSSYVPPQLPIKINNDVKTNDYVGNEILTNNV